MTIQSFARDAQRLLERNAGCSVKRTHVFELTAALFGHQSWATMRSHHLFSDAGIGSALDPKPGLLLCRAFQLGYAPPTGQVIAATLFAFVVERGLHQIAWDDLFGLVAARISDDEHRDVDLEDELERDDEGRADGRHQLSDPCVSSILLSSLAAMAASGSARAHYLLACFYRCQQPNSYLYDQSLEGRQLNAAEQAWVEQYHEDMRRFRHYQIHLQAAAQLGVRSAAVELVDDFASPQAIELLRRCANVVDPQEIVRISPTNEARWARLRDAARRDDQQSLESLADDGDRQSMERLAALGDRPMLYRLAQDAIDRHDALTAWMWHYLALIHGIDLRESTVHAYHAEGERSGEFYDSEMGGPLYADGDEGIELPFADAATQHAATQAAAARCPATQRKT